jgi:hypothetical protein
VHLNELQLCKSNNQGVKALIIDEIDVHNNADLNGIVCKNINIINNVLQGDLTDNRGDDCKANPADSRQHSGWGG